MTKYFIKSSAFLTLFLCSPFLLAQVVAEKETYGSLVEGLRAQVQLAGERGPQNINWIDEGERFSYIDEAGNGQAIRSYQPATGKDQMVFDGAGLTFPGSDKPFDYKSFQWSKDSRFILFQSNFRQVWRRSGISDYYLCSLDNRTVTLVAQNARTAELSPDGQKVAYEREGNLFVFDLNSLKETQLTVDGAEDFYNGRFGWSYEEEFGLAQAWLWSPDSKYIAFWQTDEREVPEFQMTDYGGQHAEYVKIKYPKVGDTNAIVRIGVIDIAARNTQWMNLDLGDGYIPRLYWTAKEGMLGVVHLNRKQNHLKLFFHQATTGKGRLIMEEHSDAWIDVFDFFAGIMHYFFFPENTEEFFWISDRDGWNHLYRYNYDGRLLNQVTKGEWEVVRTEAVDEKRKLIYYTSTEVSPLDRHLYSIDFKGRKKQNLTKTAGRHRINMSPKGKYFMDSYSNVNTPTQVVLKNNKGATMKVFEDNEEVLDFISKHTYAPREMFSFTTTDGQSLDGYLIKPVDFDPNKSYPLVMNIYGGPGAQSVYNAFSSNGWEQYLVQQGYVVASVNNRGSGGYGSKFKKIVYRNLGEWESKDFVETAQHLAKNSWIDGNRMAIRGHSYGGYMSSYTILNHPGVFDVALVGAPVTDWRLYDSIYTERYMDLLDDNAAGYLKSSSVTHAENLEGHMFIAHSAMDENVHMQNTMQLVKALIDAGKDHDLQIYPPGTHGVAYNGASYLLLYKQYTDYLNRHLKAETQKPAMQELGPKN
ncbi:MAG: S9 family peptidase [Cyclobacteriaceae bacterium]